jgi:predicted  nucleic acid-binding Zn-ribbon protein
VKKQIEMLARIQEKDENLEVLRQEIQEGPKRIQENEQEMEGLSARLDEDKKRLDKTTKLQRQYEMEVEDCLERIKKSKTRLLEIKSNKEYQAVLKEIEETDKTIQEKEDIILGCMEEMEKLRQAFDEKEKNLASVRQRVENEIKDIQAEMDLAQKQVLEEEGERQKMAEVVDSKILAKYERLRDRKGGVAVSKVVNATCSGCNMNIPPQMYNELQRRDELRFCPNCERIIYWKNGDGVPIQGMSE